MNDQFKVVVICAGLVGISLVSTAIMAVFFWNKVTTLEQKIQMIANAPVPTSVAVSTQDETVFVPTEAATPATAQNIEQRVAAIEKQLGKATPVPEVKTTPAKTSTAPREYIVYLGSGQTHNRDWTVMSGAGVNLDLNNYRNIRSITFEAGTSIINGEAYARLYDQTTSTPFYNSEVMNNTQEGAWRTSGSLTLPKGTHYYTVQFRSSSGEQASLLGARIKILAD